MERRWARIGGLREVGRVLEFVGAMRTVLRGVVARLSAAYRKPNGREEIEFRPTLTGT